MRRWQPLIRISEVDGRPVRARTADLYRVNLATARLPTATESDQVQMRQRDGFALELP